MTERFARRLIYVVIAVFVCGALGLAQSGRRLPPRDPDQAEKEQSKDQTIRLRTDEVLLNVTVKDPYGHQATDLSKSEFIVAEDDKRQDIASFDISTVPVNVVLLLDASGSVIGELSSLRNAAQEFVQRLTPQDKVAIMEFHLKVELLQDWTSNQDQMLHAISWRFRPGQIPKSGGNTALYDSLYIAANDVLSKVDGRKAIIMLTDGDDTSSSYTYRQALDAVIHSDTVVYVVSKARLFMKEYKSFPPAVREFEKAEAVMTDLCDRTGGEIFSPMNDDEMTDMYGKVAKELKNQYIITYTPKNDAHDGSMRHVRVYLTRPGYAARTRESYYAPNS
ncbi:MAG TPA: VWA domain-containing protein [Blastocatellia bacterium]|nr:VWA domain-containing protein [Blastocatellia bacterium]